MKSAVLSRKMHSREAATIMVAVAALFLLMTGGLSNILPQQGDQGICLPSAATWPLPTWVGVMANLALNGLIMAMMVVVNKAYNVLRAVTMLQVGLFAMMQAAVPRELLTLNSGTLVALAVISCIFLMFSCYDNPWRVRRVFLAFMILSLGAATQYCFVVFIPVFWIVCAQMRIFNARTLIASVLGLLTVWIILLGFGIVGLDNIHAPSITSVFEALNLRSALYLLLVAGFTAFLLLISTVLNVMKTIAYNARARSYNGALTIVAFMTIVAMALDYNNLLAYLPLLNMCASYQITHYFVNHRYDRQYAAVMAVCGAYILLYLWRITL